MATIVCGVNNSSEAFEAIRIARVLSADLGVRLVLAHVASGWTNGVEESLTTNQAIEGGNRLLERMVREHDVKAERRVEVGEPGEVLARIAAEEGATLIVVGSRRKGCWRPKLRRGLASELALAALCPVVIASPPVRR